MTDLSHKREDNLLADAHTFILHYMIPCALNIPKWAISLNLFSIPTYNRELYLQHLKLETYNKK